MRLFVFLLPIIILTLVGCSTNKAEEFPAPDLTDTISFSEDVFPIFSTICANPACHVDGGAGPFPLTTHAEISAETGIIIPSIRREGGVTPMPWIPGTSELAPMLEEETIVLIERWISAGRPNN